MSFNFLHIIFYFFSFVAIFSAVMVIVSRNPVRGVLFLVSAFFSMAGVWMILNAEFLALILVLVYVGAVMTLFLFVVMMLNIDLVSLRKSFVRYAPLAALIVLLVVGLTVMVIGPERQGLTEMPAPAPKSIEYSNIADLGAVLYTQYAYPFEIAAVILLAAIIAAIALTHRVAVKRKSQNISEQINVKRDERVRLVKGMQK